MIDLESCVPSLAQVRDIFVAFRAFARESNSKCVGGEANLRQEEKLLVLFGNLADAIRPIRTLLDSFVGWLLGVTRAIRVMVEESDAIAVDWAWGPFAKPGPERDADADKRRERFREDVARPMFSLALTYQKMCDTQGLDCPSKIEKYANRGFLEGFEAGPEMPLDECNAAFEAAGLRWAKAPMLGKKSPIPDPDVAADVAADVERHLRMDDVISRLTSTFEDLKLGRDLQRWIEDYASSTAPNAVKASGPAGRDGAGEGPGATASPNPTSSCEPPPASSPEQSSVRKIKIPKREKDIQVHEHLLRRPDATAEEIADALGMKPQTVRGYASWKARAIQARNTTKSDFTVQRSIQLKKKMLAVVPGTDAKPEDVLESEGEHYWQSLIDMADNRTQSRLRTANQSQKEELIRLAKMAGDRLYCRDEAEQKELVRKMVNQVVIPLRARPE